MATLATPEERLAVVEADLKNLDQKVTENFKEIKENIREVNSQLKEIIPSLVTHKELTQELETRDERIITLEKRLDKASTRNVLYTWLTGILSGILGIVLTILVQSYLDK